MDWKDPTEQEVKNLHDKLDFPIIGIIKALSPEDRKLISDSLLYKPEFKEEYLKEQKGWIEEFKWFWGKNHNKNPSEFSMDFSVDYIKSAEGERYRLYYSAKYPERMEVIHINRRTLDFLTEVEDAIKVVKSYIELTK
jgi:hypothetical protein